MVGLWKAVSGCGTWLVSATVAEVVEGVNWGWRWRKVLVGCGEAVRICMA
jgi:hypothetical protein